MDAIQPAQLVRHTGDYLGQPLRGNVRTIREGSERIRPAEPLTCTDFVAQAEVQPKVIIDVLAEPQQHHGDGREGSHEDPQLHRGEAGAHGWWTSVQPLRVVDNHGCEDAMLAAIALQNDRYGPAEMAPTGRVAGAGSARPLDAPIP